MSTPTLLCKSNLASGPPHMRTIRNPANAIRIPRTFWRVSDSFRIARDKSAVKIGFEVTIRLASPAGISRVPKATAEMLIVIPSVPMITSQPHSRRVNRGNECDETSRITPKIRLPSINRSRSSSTGSIVRSRYFMEMKFEPHIAATSSNEAWIRSVERLRMVSPNVRREQAQTPPILPERRASLDGKSRRRPVGRPRRGCRAR